MTRNARGGKGTHQRVAKDATTWDELKPPAPQRIRGSTDNQNEDKTSRKRPTKERFKKGQHIRKTARDNNKSSTDSESSGARKSDDVSGKSESYSNVSKKSKNPNIRGFGQSKAVKILGQFWVPLDDGKRLKNLLHKLKAQGLPRKEILEILKNERRKAEKSAKRQRDKTCFQCRQFGHVLSDCPNLKKAVAGDGVDESELEGASEQGQLCFKCGSTEHMSRNCKKKGDTFEFAKCFICSSAGHIARQCPQNTKGIYPSGGSCGECGATTHLKKDCPDVIGADPSIQDDPDAVTLRITNPFLSTEYEPIRREENIANVPLPPVNDEQEPIERTAPKSSLGLNFNQGGQRKLGNSMGTDFGSTKRQDLSTQSGRPPKRKIVKF